MGMHVIAMKRSKFPLIAAFAIPILGIPAPAIAGGLVPTASIEGRLLAASCFQCHSSGGFEGITGESPSETISELAEMKARTYPENIMDLVARGLTDSQIAQIAAYLATLPENGENGSED